MEKIEQTFTIERATKNTIRYQAEFDGRPPAITTIYVMKWALGQNPPDKIKVTVESQS